MKFEKLVFKVFPAAAKMGADILIGELAAGEFGIPFEIQVTKHVRRFDIECNAIEGCVDGKCVGASSVLAEELIDADWGKDFGDQEFNDFCNKVTKFLSSVADCVREVEDRFDRDLKPILRDEAVKARDPVRSILENVRRHGAVLLSFTFRGNPWNIPITISPDLAVRLAGRLAGKELGIAAKSMQGLPRIVVPRGRPDHVAALCPVRGHVISIRIRGEVVPIEADPRHENDHLLADRFVEEAGWKWKSLHGLARRAARKPSAHRISREEFERRVLALGGEIFAV